SPKNDRMHGLIFQSFPIWEGKIQGIPLTFFIYAWPSERTALGLNPSNRWYCSNIHRHPIPCALTILKGSLVQETYQEVQEKGVASFKEAESLYEGATVVDDLKEQMIHRLICRDDLGACCLSLHAHSLSSAKEVWDCFSKTFHDSSYELYRRN